MKRFLTIFTYIVFFVSILEASVTGRISISEEIAYQRYNRTWETPEYQYFSVESIALNPNFECNLDFLFRGIGGITVGTEFGYQTSIDDMNRFVTFPKNINGTVCSGFIINIKSLRISVEALLRSSFLLTRNSWISQIGGKAGFSYIFPCGLYLDMYFKFLNSYRMVTSSVAVGVGYQFGDKK